MSNDEPLEDESALEEIFLLEDEIRRLRKMNAVQKADYLRTVAEQAGRMNVAEAQRREAQAQVGRLQATQTCGECQGVAYQGICQPCKRRLTQAAIPPRPPQPSKKTGVRGIEVAFGGSGR